MPEKGPCSHCAARPFSCSSKPDVLDMRTRLKIESWPSTPELSRSSAMRIAAEPQSPSAAAFASMESKLSNSLPIALPRSCGSSVSAGCFQGWSKSPSGFLMAPILTPIRRISHLRQPFNAPEAKSIHRQKRPTLRPSSAVRRGRSSGSRRCARCPGCAVP